jgi:hypothetical protein
VVNGLVQQGIAALQTSDRRTARRLLIEAVEAHPDDAQAWRWLADAVDSPIERRFCLERVVALGDDDSTLHDELALMGPPPRPIPAPTQLINAAKRIGTAHPEHCIVRASWRWLDSF